MRKILLIAALLMLPLVRVGADEGKDLLLVTVSSGVGKNIELNLYDPTTNMSTPILQGIDYSQAMLNRAGWVAYSAPSEDRLKLYIWGSNRPEQKPIQIIGSEDADESPLVWNPNYNFLAFQSLGRDSHARIFVWNSSTASDITPEDEVGRAVNYRNVVWSPDGNYLTFEAYQAEYSGHIYVFDGRYVIDVAPQDAEDNIKYYDNPVWSSDGRLAFKAVFNGDMRSEVYVWDGRSTTNLSQSPAGRDGSPVWSVDGRLAFMSEQDGKYDILVWNGISLKDNAPDIESFTNIAPELIVYHSMLTWTSDGRLAFVAQSEPDSDFQIYAWDGKTATNISQNPTMNNFSPVWSQDGRWAQMGDNRSLKRFLIVRDADNQPIFTTKSYAYFVPAWSSSGNVMFCTFDNQGWGLSVWDGQEAHEVARGWSIYGRWQSGESVLCSSG